LDKPSKTGPLAILTAALLWSTSGLLIKYVPWHPMAIASGRSLLAAIVFIFYFRKRLLGRINPMTWLSGLALVLTQSLFVIANKLTTAANAIMLQYTTPIFIVIIGAVFFRIRPTRREILVLFWAMAGIVLFFFDDLNLGNQLGNGLAVISGLTFAAVFVLNSRPECNVPSALFIGQIGTFLIGLPFLLLTEPSAMTALPLLSIGLLGVFQLGVSYILFQYGIRLTHPLHASLLSMIEPIMNPVWVFLMLKERPGMPALLGAIVVISAMLYLNVGKMKQVEAALPTAKETQSDQVD